MVEPVACSVQACSFQCVGCDGSQNPGSGGGREGAGSASGPWEKEDLSIRDCSQNGENGRLRSIQTPLAPSPKS